MNKKAVDLSIEELAASGAKAARLALQKAQRAGLTVTGLIETFESGSAMGSLAQIHPTGTITLVELTSRATHAPASDEAAVSDDESEVGNTVSNE